MSSDRLKAVSPKATRFHSVAHELRRAVRPAATTTAAEATAVSTSGLTGRAGNARAVLGHQIRSCTVIGRRLLAVAVGGRAH